MAMSAFQQAFAAARKSQGAGGTFDFQGKSFSTNYAEESTSSKGMKKQAAVKQLENAGGDGGGDMLGKLTGGLEKLGAGGGEGDMVSKGADIAGGVATEVFGGAGSEGGEMAGGAIKGAAQGAKFGVPGAIVGAVAGGVMGLMGAKEAKKRRMKMAEAEGMKYKAQAEAQKGAIQGKMSSAFSNTLLSGMDRKVSL